MSRPNIKRVVLIGAESTGKTTLARLLAEHYKTEWVPEYAREYCEIKFAGQPIDADQHWTPTEFEEIGRIQNDLESSALTRAKRVLFCDTNARVTSIWQLKYTGSRSARMLKIAAVCEPDLYLITDPDVPFESDTIRDGEDDRIAMQDQFLMCAQNSGITFVQLKGSIHQCLQLAVKAVDHLLADSK